MDWPSFTSSIVASLAWPITVVAIIFILRRPVSSLILSIRRIHGRGYTIDFGEEVESLDQQLDEAIPTFVEQLGEVPRERTGRTTREQLERYYSIAMDDARTAVVSGWLLIEESVRDLAQRKRLGIRHYASTFQILKQLVKQKIISREVFNSINQARNLRNEAIYMTDFHISTTDARNYMALADKISSYLRSIE